MCDMQKVPRAELGSIFLNDLTQPHLWGIFERFVKMVVVPMNESPFWDG